MKLRCIKLNAEQWTGKLTIGKIYELDSISEKAINEDAMVGSTSSYFIKDDNNQYKYFLKEWFIDITEERNNKINQILC